MDWKLALPIRHKNTRCQVTAEREHTIKAQMLMAEIL